MSAAAAASASSKHTRIQDEEEEVLGGMPPAKRPAVQQCDCAQCDLCYEISALVLAALEILKANPDSTSSTTDEEQLRRLVRTHIGRSEGGMRMQLDELLPADTRRQLRPALDGFQHRHFVLRQDYHNVRERCDSDAGLSSRAMFQEFHCLLQCTLSRQHDRMRFAAVPLLHDIVIESGTYCLVVIHNCTGIALCRPLFDQLQALSVPLRAALGELKAAPRDRRCTTTHRLLLAAAYSDTDVDTVPNNDAQAAADA